jgi:signal transduction histidine kinase
MVDTVVSETIVPLGAINQPVGRVPGSRRRELGQALSLRPRSIWLLAAAGIFLTVWYLFTSRQDFVHLAFSDLTFLITSGLAAAVCLQVGLRTSTSSRTWLYLGLGSLAWFLGQVVWTFYDLALGMPPPYPSLADVGYLMLYPLFATGLILQIRANSSGTPPLEVVLDSLIVATAGAALTYKLLVAPLFAFGVLPLPVIFTALAWIVGTFVLMFLTFLAFAWSTESGNRRALTALLIGTGAFSVSNVVYGQLTLAGGYFPGHRIDLGWHLGFLLVAAAALLAAQSGLTTVRLTAAEDRDPTVIVRTAITIGGVLTGTWLAAYFALQDGPDPVAAGGVALIGLLMAVRLGYSVALSRQLGERTRERDTLERAAAVAAATEAALTHRAEELARSNAELEQFAYVASHDLQEPLRMVSSYTQLLAKRYRGKLDDDADEFIGYAVDGVTRMQQLINDLLTYSRAGRQDQPLVLIGAGDVLQSALANLSIALEESEATVTQDALPAVSADPSQLALVFQNLIANAIKFRGDQPPVIHVGVERDGAFWRFFVRDNGIGMDSQYAERVFILFQRLHTRADYQGTGIGLAVCKKIIERHGGRIWVESQPGHGATFHFTLPVKEETR